ncbi:hypothetical protein OHS18_28630 [Amycolatopsis sp. NBC_00355]|uniref:hypothetical protein n=1 Tax=Amycolatopsis sp. NBC_00355 TaxID=2975957 RepID=UPI002E264198
MDGYAVKVEELGKLVDDLGTAADRMADANRKLGGGGAFGSLGHADLGRAGVEFEEAWGYGIGRLGDAAAGITERLRQAKGKYEQIEAEFGGKLGKFGSAVFGSGDGPVGGGITGGMPGVGEPADPDERPVGGGYPGDVAGIDGLAEPGNRPVGGGATGGITDLLNGLGR